MRNRLRAALIALVSVLTLVVSSENAVAVDTVHRGPHWAWPGPSNWTASYGVYGIRITGPAAHDVLDLGFSSTGCASGATYAQSVGNYFAAKRRTYSRNGFRIGRRTTVFRPAGTSSTYRRQVLRVGFARGGIAYVGNFSFDYDYQTTVATGVSTVNYCYQRSLAIYTPKARYDTSGKARLTRVFSSLAYSGPGACLGTNGHCDPDL